MQSCLLFAANNTTTSADVAGPHCTPRLFIIKTCERMLLRARAYKQGAPWLDRCRFRHVNVNWCTCGVHIAARRKTRRAFFVQLTAKKVIRELSKIHLACVLRTALAKLGSLILCFLADWLVASSSFSAFVDLLSSCR